MVVTDDVLQVYRLLAEKMWIAARDMAPEDEETQAILRSLRKDLDEAAEFQKMEGAEFSDDEDSVEDLEHLLQGPDVYIVEIVKNSIAERERLAAEEDSEVDDEEDGAQGHREERGEERGEDRGEHLQQGQEHQKDSDGAMDGVDDGDSGSDTDTDTDTDRVTGQQARQEEEGADGDKGNQLGNSSTPKQSESDTDSAASPAPEHADSSRGSDGGWRVTKWFHSATDIVRRR